MRKRWRLIKLDFKGAVRTKPLQINYMKEEVKEVQHVQLFFHV